MELATGQEKNQGHRPRVMVADDEKNIRRAMRLILENEFDVTLVENGDKAVEKIQAGTDFDVISLDLQMPGKSGIEALKEIRQYCPTTEVLIVTAYSDLESAKQALKFGAYDYIDKPFQKQQFLEAIRRGVERRHKFIGQAKAEKQLSLVKIQLKQADKFSAIGQLLASVVHELNNPLGVILGFSDLLISKKHPAKETRQYIENIDQAARLTQKIIQRLLNVSRKHEPRRETVQINQVIQSTLDLKQHDLKRHGVKTIINLAEDLPLINGDFFELQQVFLNIINNADQAMLGRTGENILTISTEGMDGVIRTIIQDTGPGIPDQHLQQIFEPLFTTKQEGDGTGLGLSVCSEIINEHMGEIYVASEMEKGATFVVQLPAFSDTSPSPTV
jgi:signal transduction histidine kinase